VTGSPGLRRPASPARPANSDAHAHGGTTPVSGPTLVHVFEIGLPVLIAVALIGKPGSRAAGLELRSVLRSPSPGQSGLPSR
jgi:hypothetical protein